MSNAEVMVDPARTTHLKRWSVSRVKVYEECPRRYDMQYRHERPTIVSPPHWRRGSVVHAGLEAAMRAYAAGEPPQPWLVKEAPGSLLGWYDAGAVNLAFAEYALDVDAPEMHDQCHFQVSNTLEKITAPPVENVVGVEHEFLLDTPNGTPLRGFADVLVWLAPGVLLVRDYKTNSVMKPNLEWDFQLGVYAWCARQVFGATTVYGSHFHTPIGRENMVLISDDAMDAAIERLEVGAETATRDTEFEPTPSEGCESCSFRVDCPVFIAGDLRAQLMRDALRL